MTVHEEMRRRNVKAKREGVASRTPATWRAGSRSFLLFRFVAQWAGMTQEARRPLHRLTPLRDDPAAVWLTPPQRLRITIAGWLSWSSFGLLWFICWVTVLVLFRMGMMMTSVYGIMAGLALVWPVRRMIMRHLSAKVAGIVRASTPAMGADGTLVSVVGWIRAREQLPEAVAGEPCIGLALACHQKYPGVLETLNDFDLIDEAGQAVLVQVAGARILGTSNVNLTDDKARRLLIASLDLPVGAVATGWDAFVLRDGDPIMAVGFKQTTLDPTQSNLRSPPARTSLGSVPPRPLLIFPIAAERRPTSPVGIGVR